MSYPEFPIDSHLQYYRGEECKSYISLVYSHLGRFQRFLISNELNFVMISMVELTNQDLVIAKCLVCEDLKNFANLADTEPDSKEYSSNVSLLYLTLISALNASLYEQTQEDLRINFDFNHKAGIWPVELSRVANVTLISIQRTESVKVQFLVSQTLKDFLRIKNNNIQLQLQHFVQLGFESHIVIGENNLISDFFQSGNAVDYGVIQQYQAMRRFM